MSFENNKWNFPGNQHGREYGLDTPDMETFKKDPIASLAREICQNTLDARIKSELNGYKPAKLIFSTFKLETKKIPGKFELIFEIEQAIKYWRKNKNESIVKRLDDMKKILSQDEIICLRISDFNTTGLRGVKTNDRTSPFYMLTKGSGVSYKLGTTGGSKGIGKYATFVVSKLHTVFYSTVTIDNESGYLGIAKLCSGIKAVFNKDTNTFEDTTELTVGDGYFGDGIENKPIQGIFTLDPDFKRSDNETGTDIFVLGFDNTDNWKNIVIAKILESFMVAIYKGNLEIEVEGTIINNATLKDVVNSDIYADTTKKTENIIKSQYLLLAEEDVILYYISLGDYGTVELRIKDFSKSKENYATNVCTFVRYPYMKIKDSNTISTLPCSVLSIIENDKINEIFRKFENPQHTNWEFNRTDYSKQERNEARSLYRKLYEEIGKHVRDSLSNSNNQESDFDGAEDFLPDESVEIGDNSNSFLESHDRPVISKRKKKKNFDQVGYDTNDKGESLLPDLGMIDYNGEDIALIPSGHNEGNGGEFRWGDNEQNVNDGINEVFIKVPLSGLKPRIIALNPKEGLYLIKFVHIENEKECSLEINLLDDAGSKYPIEIIDAKVNGVLVDVKKNSIGKFCIKSNQLNIIELKVNQNELFSGEVNIYAYK